MLPMSGDEVFASMASVALACGMWVRWTYRVLRPHEMLGARSSRLSLLWGPVVSALLLWAVLGTLAASDVRDDARYLMMYEFMGAAWVGLATLLFPLLGLDPFVDGVERRNGRAAAAASGAVIGLTLAFAGSNIGDGPGWWVVVASAILSTGGFFAAWWLCNVASRITEVVTIDRSPAAAVRLAVLLIVAGMILGRAVAGNWVDMSATIVDFIARVWPALALPVLEFLFRPVTLPRATNPEPSMAIAGLGPALVYTLVGAADILLLGG